MKKKKENNKAYQSFIEKEEYLPYLKKLEDETKADMCMTVGSIGPFVPGMFMLAGYTKFDKDFYTVLEMYLFTCIGRCIDLNDNHKAELALWKLMRYIHGLEDLHIDIEGEPMDMKLGGMVMNTLLSYFWSDYCEENKDKVE